MKNILNGLGIVFALVLTVAIVVGGPLVTIWILNTLFATGIEYTLTAWFAALLLQLTIAGLTKEMK